MSENPKRESGKGTVRTTISLNAGLHEKAVALMKENDFSSFSDFIEYLIREKLAAKPKNK